MKYLIHMVIKMTTFKTNILPKQTSTLGEVWCDPVQIFTKLYNYLKKKNQAPQRPQFTLYFLSDIIRLCLGLSVWFCTSTESG